MEVKAKKRSSVWDFLNCFFSDVRRNLKDNPDQTIVLFNEEEYEHNTDDNLIEVIGTDVGNFVLTTGNLIGFVSRGEYSLKISSRFGDAFLRFIIADADGFLELENYGGEMPAEGYEWLLAYLWNIKLKRAYRLGVPKTYITKTDQISRVRGTIDVVDYFRNKTSGKYLCSYREHSYDCPAASLFLKAYETVWHYSFCDQTRNIYHAFLAVSQGEKRTRQEILQTPHFTNPFYIDYNVLIDLSKRIISRYGSDFADSHDSSAFLFDVSMLFEYFIRQLLKRDGIILRDKYDLRPEIPTGSVYSYRRKLEPDLVIEADNGLYIFDVKYKAFNANKGVKREDLFQLHTYIGQYGNDAMIRGGGFIYPMSEEQWTALELDKTQGLIRDDIRQQGRDIPFYFLFLKIPAEGTAPDSNKKVKGQIGQVRKNEQNFIESMKQQCDVFTKVMRDMILAQKPLNHGHR